MTDITINIKTGQENSEPKITTTTDNAKALVPKAESPSVETPKAETKEETTSGKETPKDESVKKDDPKKTPPPKTADDPEQYKRFLEAAKEAGADETAKGADKAFRSVVKPRKPKNP